MKRLKKRKGVALAIVIMFTFITMLFFTAVISYFNSNTLLTYQERNQLKAYFISQAGLDIATAACYQENADTTDSTVMLNLFERWQGKSGPSLPALGPNDSLSQTIVFDQSNLGQDGTADINIKSVLIDGKTYIVATSTGVFKDKNGRPYTSANSIRFNLQSPSEFVRTTDY